MQQIKELLLQTPHDYNSILMWAVSYTAFFGFLRCSEFNVIKEQDYDSNVHLIYADVAIDCKKNPQILQLHIKQSKYTHLERISSYASLRRNNCAVCPMSAILPYLAVRGAVMPLMVPPQLVRSDHLWKILLL